jgi:hypothetical protein
MYKVSNIVKGAATVVFAGAPIGYTRDATVISPESENLVIDDIQQIIGVADVRRTKFKKMVKANLYEATLENIGKAWGLNSSVQISSGAKSISFNVSGDYPEGELVIYTKGPGNVNRTFKWWSAKLIETGDYTMDAHGATVIPVTFQILVHPDHSDLGNASEEYSPSGTVQEYY